MATTDFKTPSDENLQRKIRQLESALRDAVYAISKSCDYCPLVMDCHGDCQRELYQYFLEGAD